jgi:hypothetical protein
MGGDKYTEPIPASEPKREGPAAPPSEPPTPPLPTE